MHLKFRIFLVTACVCMAAPLSGADFAPQPNWDEKMARAAAHLGESDDLLNHLKQGLYSDDPKALLNDLKALENRHELPWPAREAALLGLIRELRFHSADSVPPGVLDYLSSWQAKTLVASDHQESVGVPLYKIREALAGTQNAWRHDAAVDAGLRILRSQPERFLEAWSSAADPAARLGYLDALQVGKRQDVEIVHRQTMAGLASDPELTDVAARTAVVLRDLAALERIILVGQGAGVTQALRGASSLLSADEAKAIIETAVDDTAAVGNTALAIATWAPLLGADDKARALLRSLSGDENLGAAAVLALQTPPEVQSGKSDQTIEGGNNPRIVSWSGDSLANPSDNQLSLGYPVPIPVDTPLPFDGFRTYSGLRTRYLDLAENTQWVHPAEVGMSHGNRTVWAYRLGDEDFLTPYGLPEAASLINGGIHAREWQSPEVATGIIELMAEKAGDDYFYDYLLENANMIVVPVLNVDGFLQTQRYPSTNWFETDPLDRPNEPQFSPRDGRMRRKNMPGVDEILNTQGDHLLGVDLNRNFSPLWATSNSSSPDPTSLVYHGESALSEPETQALITAAELGPIEQLRTYTDLHSFAQVHYWTRTTNGRLNSITYDVMGTFSQHHAAFPSGRFYGFGQGQEPGVGAGFAYEYFPYQLGTVGWLTEIEPKNSCCWPPPTAGAEYGGVVENGHDGFILPESQIRRVREEMAQSFAAVYYQMAGPPSITRVHFVDVATGSTVYEAEWDVIDDSRRELNVIETQALQFDREYTLWLSYDKPMRWRSEGELAPFPGQAESTLDINAGLFVGESNLSVDLGIPQWLDTPGDSPAGYDRYRDDAFAVNFTIPSDGPNSELGAERFTGRLNWSAFDMTGQENDADPSTVARWQGGHWVGYEDSDGEDSDSGGIDKTLEIPLTNTAPGDPFVLEAGTSSAWYDPSHSGEGFMLEILEVLYWFTYDGEGQQDWYVAIGEIRGNRILFPELLQVSGGVFGPDFDPEKVSRAVVGSASFIWSSCEEGTMKWQIGNRHGRQQLLRISRVMGIDCGNVSLPPVRQEALFSGSWFDPSHDGEGYTLEVLIDGRVLVYWFSFDPAGARRWFFGVGEIQDGSFVFDEMLTTQGGIFGSDFDPDTVNVLPWGTLILSLSCTGGTANYESTESGFGSGVLNLVRLSILSGLPCGD
jgi:hypothetical protein